MHDALIQVITSAVPAVRDQPFDRLSASWSAAKLLAEAESLDQFRRQSDNLYHRVRALFFLYAIHRFQLPAAERFPMRGHIPFGGYTHLLQRRFEEAIESFLQIQRRDGPSDALSSALAAAYQRLGFQTLADQVRRSVRAVRGNQWMFRMGHAMDHPLRVRRELLGATAGGDYPILAESTPVRLDLSHSAWSDIFFLGMDYPEGARVLNASIDLTIDGRGPPKPPIECYFRVIDHPVLRLISVDLAAQADIEQLGEVFDFAKDYLGLLKAAVIASGLVPPGVEGADQDLSAILTALVGPGRGIEIVSSVNEIPKGSRLAVSTNLLASLISVCMRATGQTEELEGPLAEAERRLVAARAILGEWLGGSGGGWQDSGGIWPGIKLIEGVLAAPGDPEYGISRGRLLPAHRILGPNDMPEEMRRALQQGLVLVHGGMAQNVGPVLEMVTEKYLLRWEREWAGRQQALSIFDEIVLALRENNLAGLGAATTRNFEGPLQTIIPAATNFFTETVVARTRRRFGADFLGFWMLGGMSGGGMGFIFSAAARAEGKVGLHSIMLEAKRELQAALPFAIDPVVYDFALNDGGTVARLLHGSQALLPAGYYALTVPALLRSQIRDLSPAQRSELDHLAQACRERSEFSGMVQTLFDRMLPRSAMETAGQSLVEVLACLGFDRAQHQQIQAELRSSRIGLAQNRLPPSTNIEDAGESDVVPNADVRQKEFYEAGAQLLAEGKAGVVTLAAGAGSRWTQGAGVVKALHPFWKFGGRHRTFIEAHLAKSRRTAQRHGAPPPHIFTTSYLTHEPIERFLAREEDYGYSGPLLLSPGRAVGQRLVPMIRDLRFMWEEMPQQLLDEQQQKVRDSLRSALVAWVRQAGEAGDYTDNIPVQCVHPVGHWYEVPNLFRNGVLVELLRQRPQLKYLLLHNIDTLGADLDPALLGFHARSGAALTFEVVPRRLEDRGGGLARVNGRIRLVEGLAMPREEQEFALTYYNSMTTWIDIDALLNRFELDRASLADEPRVIAAIRRVAAQIPTYITLKEVKKRWGHGQEDVYPVAQFEKLWSDLTVLPDFDCRFVAVTRARGQQLKEQAQIDSWLRDGSSAHVASLCEF